MSFLDIDETAGILEKYLDAILREQPPEKEVINLSEENDFIYLAAVSNTQTISQILHGYKSFFIDLIGRYSSTKEHIAKTAKFLFGNDYEIDFSNLHDTGRFPYNDYFGVGEFSAIVKTGYRLVVVDYADMGDTYEVETVFLYWDVMHSRQTPTDYFYDDAGNLKNLTEQEAKEYCRNVLPRYRIQVRKGEDGSLYFVSKVAG